MRMAFIILFTNRNLTARPEGLLYFPLLVLREMRLLLLAEWLGW